MRLIDWVHGFGRRAAVPLVGYPGIQLTESTIKQKHVQCRIAGPVAL